MMIVEFASLLSVLIFLRKEIIMVDRPPAGFSIITCSSPDIISSMISPGSSLMKRNIIYRIYLVLKSRAWHKLLYVFLLNYDDCLLFHNKSMNDIYKWVEKNIDAYDIYSFDLFDTLLRRKIHPPELPIQLACNCLSGRLKRQGKCESSEQLLAKRLEIARRLQGKAVLQNRDAEFRLADVLQSLLKAIAADNTIECDQLVNYETGLEELVTEPMPYVENILTLIKNSGKRMICISDTYYSGSQISRILEKNNLLHFFDHIYISSDILLNKRGNLFRHVIQNENGKIVHIGNSVSDDVYMAGRAGIKSIWYNSKSEKKRTYGLSKLLLGNDKFKYMNAIVKRQQSDDITFNLGYEVFGPVLTVCVHNIIEKIREQKQISRVFFVARDGFILKKIYQLLVAGIYDESDGIPHGNYLCINKSTLTLASITHIGYDEIDDLEKVIKQNKIDFTLADILKSYSLYTEEFVNLLSRNGIVNIQDTIKDVHENKLIRQFISSENIQNTIESLSILPRKDLNNYLSSVGFLGNCEIAIVDSESSGKTTALLRAALRNHEDLPEMNGYYICYLGRETPDGLNQSTLDYGFLTDCRTDGRFSHMTLHKFSLIAELITQPNHGITIGYKTLTDRTIPIFRKTDGEGNYRLRSVVNDGILTYAKDYAKYYRAHQLHPEQLLNGAKKSAARYISFPNGKDVRELKNYYFTRTWPTESSSRLIEDIHFMDLVKISTLKKKLIKKVWIEGILTNMPIPGLVILYHLMFKPYFYLKRLLLR